MQLLSGAHLASGEVVDVLLDGDRVARVGPVASVRAPADADRVDLSGYLLAGAFAEPHAHLDKAFTIEQVDNPEGTLAGAMAGYGTLLATATDEDVQARARRALLHLVANGVTAVRSHVGCGRLLGTRAIESVVAVREKLRDVVDLEIVAHIGGPAAGETWAEHSDRLRQALDAGADAVGGNPAVEADPIAALQACLAVAIERGCPVDLHTDETTDVDVLTLRELARLAAEAPVPVTASHCVSLGQQSAGVAAAVAAELAAAGVTVVTLPATNLYLQGRGRAPVLRGLTALDALDAAGVRVAGGGDNAGDPFNPTGRLDPLETASLLVTAGHRTLEQAWSMVGPQARAVIGAAPAAPEPGARADLVAIRARSVQEAIAFAPADRWVWRAGRLVSRTRVQRSGITEELDR